MKRVLFIALIVVATFGLTGCRLVPSSPGFLPDGSGLWFIDQDRDDDGDGDFDTTVRTWAYWCFGTPEEPEECGTERNWAWGDLWSVPYQPQP